MHGMDGPCEKNAVKQGRMIVHDGGEWRVVVNA